MLNGAFYEGTRNILKQVWSEDFDDYLRVIVRSRRSPGRLGKDSDAQAKLSKLLLSTRALTKRPSKGRHSDNAPRI